VSETPTRLSAEQIQATFDASPFLSFLRLHVVALDHDAGTLTVSMPMRPCLSAASSGANQAASSVSWAASKAARWRPSPGRPASHSPPARTPSGFWLTVFRRKNSRKPLTMPWRFAVSLCSNVAQSVMADTIPWAVLPCLAGPLAQTVGAELTLAGAAC